MSALAKMIGLEGADAHEESDEDKAKKEQKSVFDRFLRLEFTEEEKEEFIAMTNA